MYQMYIGDLELPISRFTLRLRRASHHLTLSEPLIHYILSSRDILTYPAWMQDEDWLKSWLPHRL